MPKPYPKTLAEYNQRELETAKQIVELVEAVRPPETMLVVPLDRFPDVNSDHLRVATSILNRKLPSVMEGADAPRRYTWDARGGADGRQTNVIYLPTHPAP